MIFFPMGSECEINKFYIFRINVSLRMDQCVLETVSNYYGPEPSTNYCGAPLRVYMKKIILKFLSLSSLDLICFFVMPLLLYVVDGA